MQSQAASANDSERAAESDRSAPASPRSRVLLDACVAGAHAHQILLHRRSGKGNPEAFGAPDAGNARLAGYVSAHQRLLASEPERHRAWLRDADSSVADALSALSDAPRPTHKALPVNAAARFFAARTEAARTDHAYALAHLLQVNLEEDRDGGLLQDTFRFLKVCGLLSAPTDFGFLDDNDAFLTVVRDIAKSEFAAPYRTDAFAWQLSLRRVQNWAMRYRGERSAEACAQALLEETDIAGLLPALQALKPQHIMVVGFSYTMRIHWSTDAPMNAIASAVLARVNPGVTFGHLGHGGMRMRQARERYLDAALHSGAQHVFLVASFETEADYAAASAMAAALRSVGVRKICVFDRLHPDPEWRHNPDPEKLHAMASAAGIEVIKVAASMRNHPLRETFVSLDGIHMRTPYHMWMAQEWLAWLARQVPDSSEDAARD